MVILRMVIYTVRIIFALVILGIVATGYYQAKEAIRDYVNQEKARVIEKYKLENQDKYTPWEYRIEGLYQERQRLNEKR